MVERWLASVETRPFPEWKRPRDKFIFAIYFVLEMRQEQHQQKQEHLLECKRRKMSTATNAANATQVMFNGWADP